MIRWAKRKMMRMSFSLFILLFVSASSGLASDQNMTTDGIFKFKDVALKFTPPQGWEVNPWVPASLIFRSSGEAQDSIVSLSVGISAENVPGKKGPYGEDYLKDLTVKAKKDANFKVLKDEIISFSGSKALDLEMESTSNKVKARTITFVKGDRQFEIRFVAGDEKFGTLMPEVSESLKTFEILPPDPAGLAAKEVLPDYAVSLRNEFRVILEKLCLEMLTVAQQDKDTRVFDELPGATLQEKSQNASLGVLTQYKTAVEVPAAEAEKILKGEIDDEKNAREISDCVSKFQDAGASLPVFFQLMLEKFHRHALSSLEVELTARILEAKVHQMETPS